MTPVMPGGDARHSAREIQPEWSVALVERAIAMSGRAIDQQCLEPRLLKVSVTAERCLDFVVFHAHKRRAKGRFRRP
jgi:hypothetical protein